MRGGRPVVLDIRRGLLVNEVECGEDIEKNWLRGRFRRRSCHDLHARNVVISISAMTKNSHSNIDLVNACLWEASDDCGEGTIVLGLGKKGISLDEDVVTDVLVGVWNALFILVVLVAPAANWKAIL